MSERAFSSKGSNSFVVNVLFANNKQREQQFPHLADGKEAVIQLNKICEESVM